MALTKERPDNPEGYPEELYPSGRRTYMRVCPADDVQGAAAADFAASELGAKRVWVLHDGEIYGEGVARIFRDAFAQLGGEILGFEGFDPDATSYQELMTRIAASEPDLIYVGAIVNLNVPRLLKDMRREMPWDAVHCLAPDGLLNQNLIDEGGEAADRVYVTFVGVPPGAFDARGVTWYRRMSERLGHGPSLVAIHAFEAAIVVLQAIDAAGEKDRSTILEHMLDTSDFRGMMTPWSFTDTGDTTSQVISVNQVRFDHFIYLDVISSPGQE